nr:MAG TPA: hypothetical protein [Caudoviricetes sp.]
MRECEHCMRHNRRGKPVACNSSHISTVLLMRSHSHTSITRCCCIVCTCST